MAANAEKMILLNQLDRAIEGKNRAEQKKKDEEQKKKDEEGLYWHAAETLGTACVISLFEKRTGRQNWIDGIPLDLTVAAVAFGIGSVGPFKEHAKHAFAVGAGALSIYARRLILESPIQARAPMPALAAAAGTAGAFGGGGLTDAELARLVQASRQL